MCVQPLERRLLSTSKRDFEWRRSDPPVYNYGTIFSIKMFIVQETVVTPIYPPDVFLAHCERHAGESPPGSWIRVRPAHGGSEGFRDGGDEGK